MRLGERTPVVVNQSMPTPYRSNDVVSQLGLRRRPDMALTWKGQSLA